MPTRRPPVRTWTGRRAAGVLRGASRLPVRAAREARRRLGSRAHRLSAEPIETWGAPFVERGAQQLLGVDGPDVVVLSSIYRRAWLELRPRLIEMGIPSVVYLRDETEIANLRLTEAPPDVLLANAESHASIAVSVGLAATVIPSVIDLDLVRVNSTREVVLYVNPTPSRGLDLACALAARCPDIPFVFQESSHAISDRDRRHIRERVVPNESVEIRPFQHDSALVYADARLLLAPYVVGNRPRVILEAQANGIPVLAPERPGLSEAVGPGGVLVDRTDVSAWVDELHRLWDDVALYERFVDRAYAHARRPEVDADALTDRFLAQLELAVGEAR